MKRLTLRKILIGCGLVTLCLTVVLVVHIYQMTHRKITDPNAVALARIDFYQSFSNTDAANFSNWFAQQTGIQRSVFSPQNQNAVIAYYPAKTNVSTIIEAFIGKFNVNAKRYLPSKEQMMQGCPVAAN